MVALQGAMPFDAVLFDMDGVLVSSVEAWFRTVEAAGVRFRGRPVSRDDFMPTFGQGTAADIPTFGFDCTAATLDAFYVEEFARHLDGVAVDAEAAPLLEALARAGVKRAVVTNTVSPLAQQVLAHAGLDAHFDFIGTSDLVARAKPAPDLLHLACARLGVGEGRAVFVGDSPYDRGAASAAGVRFFGLGLDGDVRLGRLGDFPVPERSNT